MTGDFKTLTQSSTPVLVDFFATWCGPCKAMSPILRQLKEKLGDDIKIVKIDVDINGALAQKYNVQGVPTLMLFKNGKTLWRKSGVVPLNQLESIVKQHTV
jgi:thioredoxin 1